MYIVSSIYSIEKVINELDKFTVALMAAGLADFECLVLFIIIKPDNQCGYQ